MDLSQALKSGILPDTANPVDIVLTAFTEGLEEILQKQIKRHHNLMKKVTDPDDARKKFKLTCDFTETEIANMPDMYIWSKNSCQSESSDDMAKSMYIDDYAVLKGINTMTVQSSLGILKSLRRKKMYRPIDDSTVNTCYKCSSVFSIFNRRHHCRACGRIFCYNCSQWSERVPSDVIRYSDTKKWVVPEQLARVCQSCKDVINNFRRIEYLIKYFEITAYPIQLCVKASTLCRDWREAIRIYLSNIRDLQYCVPSSLLQDRDKRALLSNLQGFQGHNKWMLQVLKIGLISIDKNVKDGFIGERTTSCQDMMCDYNCIDILNACDALIILNTPIYNIEVKLYALRILEHSILPPGASSFLPIEDKNIQDFVLKFPNLFLDFFWTSRINQGLHSDMFCNKLILANQKQAKRVQESLQLVLILDSNDTNTCELSKKLQSLKVPFIGPFGTIDKFGNDIIIKNSATRPMIINYYRNGEKHAFLYKKEDIRKDAHVVSLISLMYDLCKDIFSSFTEFLPSTSPININEQNNNGNAWFNVTSPFTPDVGKYYYSKPSPSSLTTSLSNSLSNSLANSLGEKMSQQMETIIDEKYHDFIQPNKIYLATYRVIPVSIGSGFIEIVPNSSTLFDILNRGTISNFLYRGNMDKKISEINSNYSASLAFWTVITYLLGVGDRHLENIMIRNDGILFHIDYGFIFDADATASFVRLDHNLIECLGGLDMYEPFKLRCCQIYCCLRRHFSLICACLLRLSSIQPPIKSYNFTSEFIEKFIADRFFLGQTENEAKEAFSKIIDSSRETLLNKVSDVIHHTVSSFKVGGWWSY